MINFTGLELAVVLLIGLIFLGPEQMKQVARFLGRLIRGFKKITSEVTNYLESTLDEENHKRK